MKRYVASIFMLLASSAYALTDAELEDLEKICTTHYIGARAPAGPVQPYKWQAGWEKCEGIHEAYMKATPGIAAKAKAAKDEADRQKINNAIVKVP